MNKQQLVKMFGEEEVNAYEKLDIEPKGEYEYFEESYVGEFLSDVDFAMDMAENSGAIDFKKLPWPAYCIDWEYAAKELMYDFSEQDGFYFRNI